MLESELPIQKIRLGVMHDLWPWWVMRVATNSEFLLQHRVRSLGYGAIAPWHEGQRRIRGSSRRWRFPLFRGYLFVAMPNPSVGWQHIAGSVNTPERRLAYRLLGVDAPDQLKPEDVVYLQSIADGRYRSDDNPRAVVVGDTIIVPDGHLEGKEGVVVRVKCGKSVTILVSGEKNDVVVEIPLARLDKE